jgi:hypothetical protein
MISEATNQMVIYHPGRLHKRIAYCRAHKFESPFLNYNPAQSGLKAIQQEKLKQFAVIVQGNPPFVIMVLYVDRIVTGPWASIFHKDQFLRENERCENT